MTPDRTSDARRAAGPVLYGLAGLAAALLCVGLISANALICTLKHGTVALFIVGGSAGWGMFVLRRAARRDSELAASWAPGAGLGIGLTALLVFGLGSAGAMGRWLWIAYLAIGAAMAVAHVPMRLRRAESPDRPGRERWLWAGVAPFFVLALVAAALPPGVLWPAEGNGYDVLEYHLAAPREYFDAGRIGYLPHNLYSNFPLNVEMLYLLSMIVHGAPVPAAATAQMVNVLLAVLAVVAVGWAARPLGRSAAVCAALLAASCPFVVYLCGVAYVECGMLAFAALALGAVVRGMRAAPREARGWMVLGGAFAGFACGCKYTGVTAVLIPLVVVVLWQRRRQRPDGAASAVVFVLAAAATFSPWLVRNAVSTGNPVFPLAQRVMPMRAGVWDADGAARWHEGHLPDPMQRSLPARVSRLWSEVIASPMFGWLIPLALAATVAMAVAQAGGGRKPVVVGCWLMAGVGLFLWAGWTHLVGRFAIVSIVPVCVVIGAALGAYWPVRPRGMCVLVVATAALNLGTTTRMFNDSQVWGLSGIEPSWFLDGRWPGQAHVPRLNALAANGHRVLMVGDARSFYLQPRVDYCVVFNRNAFAGAARGGAEAALTWLRENNYSYLYVDWGEMRRLRRSRYGFWESIDATLFMNMQRIGFKHEQDFTLDLGKGPHAYSSLFRVTQ